MVGHSSVIFKVIVTRKGFMSENENSSIPKDRGLNKKPVSTLFCDKTYFYSKVPIDGELLYSPFF